MPDAPLDVTEAANAVRDQPGYALHFETIGDGHISDMARRDQSLNRHLRPHSTTLPVGIWK
jgi:hypothetical protein